MAMGFSSNAAKHGLVNNNMDPNGAVGWLFDKMGDPSLELPLE